MEPAAQVRLSSVVWTAVQRGIDLVNHFEHLTQASDSSVTSLLVRNPESHHGSFVIDRTVATFCQSTLCLRMLNDEGHTRAVHLSLQLVLAHLDCGDFSLEIH
jgi:hypothetical protein